MTEKALDVVCGMMLDPDTAPAATTYHAEVYYFCGPPCQAAFEEHPWRYIDEDAGVRQQLADHQEHRFDNSA